MEAHVACLRYNHLRSLQVEERVARRRQAVSQQEVQPCLWLHLVIALFRGMRT